MKRFERSNGLDTALYKNDLYLLFVPKTANCPFGLLSLYTEEEKGVVI